MLLKTGRPLFFSDLLIIGKSLISLFRPCIVLVQFNRKKNTKRAPKIKGALFLCPAKREFLRPSAVRRLSAAPFRTGPALWLAHPGRRTCGPCCPCPSFLFPAPSGGLPLPSTGKAAAMPLSCGASRPGQLPERPQNSPPQSTQNRPALRRAAAPLPHCPLG